MPRLTARDLSATRGRRYRIRLDNYQPRTRTFAPVKGFSLLFNVLSAPQRDECWKAITEALQKKLDEFGDGLSGAPDDAGAPVSADSPAGD